MSQEFDNNVLDLINQKGFYRYDYMSYFEKFKKEFPQKEKFCGSLTDRKISDKEYEHVLKWNIFEMKTLKDYHDLYSKYEVLLLAFVFEKFRNNNFMDYGLCPGHYLSVLGLSWDAMRRKTKIELGLLPDPDMYIFFEKGTRGGISYISNRYSKANNKYIKYSDSKQESKHIRYLDANNSYGYATSKPLPTNDSNG